MAPLSSTKAYFGLGLSVGLVIAFTLNTYSPLNLAVPKNAYHASYVSELSSDVDVDRGFNQGKNNPTDRTQQIFHSHKYLDKQIGPDKEFHFKDEHAHRGECFVFVYDIYR